ncbi:DUF3791 domain-containing protein [Prevotella sp. PINT]|jgi:hypothetical protein|uniref:DUF3791 domain-containing protein n=1 Tax=Palleniella intestinalis TaxID=2736291 RepID=UPI001553EFF1|nr:DUF3791 domain-containing protein [Palleniella intestinalis]NPD82727.1 DUF3791 domain-containing protein [Palleniella intestinalis]
MLNDILLWNKIGRIITLIHKALDISPEQAFDTFYSSKTCSRLHDHDDYLYLMGDLYIVDELLMELKQPAK